MKQKIIKYVSFLDLLISKSYTFQTGFIYQRIKFYCYLVNYGFSMVKNQEERKKKKVETFCSTNLLNGKKWLPSIYM